MVFKRLLLNSQPLSKREYNKISLERICLESQLSEDRYYAEPEWYPEQPSILLSKLGSCPTLLWEKLAAFYCNDQIPCEKLPGYHVSGIILLTPQVAEGNVCVCASDPVPLRQVLQVAKHPLHSLSSSSSEKQQRCACRKIQREMSHWWEMAENAQACSYLGER